MNIELVLCFAVPGALALLVWMTLAAAKQSIEGTYSE